MTPPRSAGYVTDVPYARNFIREQAPAWLDHVALIGGFAPPDRRDSFSWCDLGCGQGVTAALLASTHPTGSFQGIDVMPVHIRFARDLAAAASISNVSFDALDFDQAADLDFAGFDYIVSHGVYSWVSERSRQSWLRFIDRHLKPGGLVYVSYNAMPGRAADLPFQRLVRELGLTLSGNSVEQVAGAIDFVRLMTAGLKVPALVASPFAMALQEHNDRYSSSYLAHELMNGDWEPLCVTDVRGAMADIGLKPAGSATLIDNHDSFILGKTARELLATIPDRDVRELTRDYLIDQFFRRDVFIRNVMPLSSDAQRSRLMESAFFLSRPAGSVEYSMKTPAGKLSFDNAAARHIVTSLDAGPRRLSDIVCPSIPEQDLIANILVLGAASAVWPVESSRASTAALNTGILSRVGTAGEIDYIGLPFGTAFPVRGDLLLRIKNRENPESDPLAGWLQSLIEPTEVVSDAV